VTFRPEEPWRAGKLVAGRRISHPLGTDHRGYITYSEDGYMFVAIMRANRRRFSAGDLLRGTPEEKAHAAETYVSYCGTYEFRGETVIHHVELSLFPNWVGHIARTAFAAPLPEWATHRGAPRRPEDAELVGSDLSLGSIFDLGQRQRSHGAGCGSDRNRARDLQRDRPVWSFCEGIPEGLASGDAHLRRCGRATIVSS